MIRLDPVGRARVDQRELSRVAAERHELLQAVRAARAERRRPGVGSWRVLHRLSRLLRRGAADARGELGSTTVPAPAPQAPHPEPAC